MNIVGIVFALLSALAYSFSAVIVGKRLHESNYISVAFVVSVIGNIILWPLVLLFISLREVSLESILFFVIAGILHPGISRLLYYKGIEFVGVSINASIVAMYPMFSSIFAVLLFGEALTLGNWVGIVCIIIAVVFLERSLSKCKNGPKRVFKKSLVFPLFSSLIIALAYIVRKHGLNIYNEPLFGVAIGYSSSFLLYFLLLIYSPTMRGSLLLGKDFRSFWKVGVCLSLAWGSAFYALSHERVSTVTPLIQTQPLFILFFAYIYLKELEHISFKLIISTLLMVTGVMVVSIC